MNSIIIDLETTGIDAKHDRIIEVGVVWVGGYGGIAGVLETLVRPGDLWERRWAEESGIRPADVEHAPGFGEIAPGLLWLIAMADQIIGYNLGFDIGFLTVEFARLGVTFPLRQKVDLMTRRRTLQAACEVEGIETPPGFVWHRALADATMTYRLWRKLGNQELQIETRSASGRFVPGF